MVSDDKRHTLHSRPNRLANEKSPYLLQHAYNPVDWYPWGEEAFKKSRTRNVPIFLSIGYSSCHWCHVMEKESFEDGDVANLMNENFVSIKVDREERPDIDQVYMKAVQAITGSGGWPLNVFLTPELAPFYGGTYFPPVSRYGMPGFSSVLKSIVQAWKNDRENIVASAERLMTELRDAYAPSNSYHNLDESLLVTGYEELSLFFDREYGGFGTAPKFPTPSNIFFLLRYYQHTKEKTALQIVTKTLDAMSKGGIFDHVGGGFHRYSTDRFWLVPHFEKMLYDNALLSTAYTEAFLVTHDLNYRRVVEETLEWALREMNSETGGFFSAQDADSPDGEGSCYVWSKGEINEILSREIGKQWKKENLQGAINLILKYFSVTEKGNFEGGRSILTASKDPQDLAKESVLSEGELSSLISMTKKILRDERSKRPKPMTDDKILTSWNGMLISALSKASQAFDEPLYSDKAVRAADFILENMLVHENNNVRLKRRFRNGETKNAGLLEDYAYFGNSLIDLYEATFKPKYIRLALEICDAMIEKFFDSSNGGFFETPPDLSDLIVRPKEAYDGAIPSGNSIAAVFCLRIAEITSNDDYRKKAESTFRTFSTSIEKQPSSFTEMLVGISFYLGKPKEIVISGVPEANKTVELIEELRRHFLPDAVTLLADPSLENSFPLIQGRLAEKGQDSMVFVCSNFTCKLPSRTAADLKNALLN